MGFPPFGSPRHSVTWTSDDALSEDDEQAPIARSAATASAAAKVRCVCIHGPFLVHPFCDTFPTAPAYTPLRSFYAKGTSRGVRARRVRRPDRRGSAELAELGATAFSNTPTPDVAQNAR